LLKRCWDVVGVVESTFQHWRETLWAEVRVDDMALVLRDLQASVAAMDPKTRPWQLSHWLNQQCKQMGVVLPLIQVLYPTRTWGDSVSFRQRRCTRATNARSTVDVRMYFVGVSVPVHVAYSSWPVC
jgi:hypothetical protein